MALKAELLDNSLEVLEQVVSDLRDEVDGTVALETESFLKLLDGIRQASAFVYGVTKTLVEISEVEDAAAKDEVEEEEEGEDEDEE